MTELNMLFLFLYQFEMPVYHVLIIHKLSIRIYDNFFLHETFCITAHY